MKVFNSKDSLVPGTSYDEVLKFARKEFQKIANLTKRSVYVRSAYFNKEKIFIAPVFWTHQSFFTDFTEKQKMGTNFAFKLSKTSVPVGKISCQYLIKKCAKNKNPPRCSLETTCRELLPIRTKNGFFV